MKKKTARHPRFFKNLRWKRAMRYIDEADECEVAYDAATALGLDDVATGHARKAMEAYLKAIKWWPLTGPQMIPLPEDGQAHNMYSGYEPCVICSIPVPEGQLYCTTCL